MTTQIKFAGYHDEKDLPIRRGMTVTIVKGTPIRHRGETVIAKRTYKVKVNHIMNGTTDAYYDWERKERVKVPQSNPSVVWPGKGSYWSEVDINFIPEAQKLAVFL